MSRQRPYVMTIAGFDPSGGAGILADIKTFEQLKVYGFAVMTANTFQDDAKVERVDWIPLNDILKQIDIILDKFDVQHFKIGIVNGAEMLNGIKSHILKRKPKAFITWDPVLKSTGGSSFFEGQQTASELVKGLKLVTPNKNEFAALFGSEELALKTSEQTMIYLKGGHNAEKPGLDQVFAKGKITNYRSKESRVSAKHGSGCTMASALTSHFALGFKTHQTVLKSKRYIERVLSSNTGLLGYHKL